MRRFILGVALWLAVPLAALAQVPDRRGEVALQEPSYQGVRANAPIPHDHHFRNEGGSDGQGLCVICSVVINGHYQGVPGLDAGKQSALWRAAKSAPGGYSPDKLARLVDQVMPGEKWASYVGRDTGVLHRLSSQGYPIGATMNTGAQYGYRPIHHMISLIHYQTGGYACVVDNNDPGRYHWMPAAEFDRRWIDGGTGWAWIWTRLPKSGGSLAIVVGACAVLLIVVTHFKRAMDPEFSHE